ncbi:hypothetical protein ACHAXR_008355 [Thalassiosira sp. AJA248-18]
MVPHHVEREHTLNWFRVFWDGDGDYPGSSDANSCAANGCEETHDGSCLCKTKALESIPFGSVDSISKEDILHNLFIGAVGPPSDSVPSARDGFTAHIVGGDVDQSTVLSGSNISFRNVPHFTSLIGVGSRGGEQNLRNAQYESDAVLEHYFYHDNVAPFLCTRIMQRFSFSNPSPRYVASCVEAFRSGSYSSGGEIFGSGEYGNLEAMAASILLDREATDVAVTSDPSFGSLMEPMIKNGDIPMSRDFQVRLWEIDKKIGQGSYS